jgi:hypothetical protein
MKNKDKNSLTGFLPDYFYIVYSDNFISAKSLLGRFLIGFKLIRMKIKSVS